MLSQVRIGAPAHGGHCVARVDGRVVFVRHTAPGELVDVTLTATGDGASYWRGDATRILEPSPDRVEHVWPLAGPGGAGGAELGHLTLAAQREWKTAVLAESLRRFAGLDLVVPVQAVPGESDGLASRTRIELTIDDAGRPAMHRHRSHDLVPVAEMPLAVPALATSPALTSPWRPGARLDLVATSTGEQVVLLDGEPVQGRTRVTEHVVVERPHGESTEYALQVEAAGFWQVHPQAPSLLASRVLAAADPQPGERVLELYAGAGLLTLPLADAVGPSGAVVAVEAPGPGARAARRNARAHPWIQLVAGDVERVLRAGGHDADVVVLDPPRAGAGKRVVEQITALAPRRIVYVACDPVALARDLAIAARSGYALAGIEAFDLFPHTHHLECVAVLERG